MSFAEWLSSIGQVITQMLSWIGSCFDVLKSNYIILTILGISIFYWLFGIIRNLITKIHFNSLERKYKNIEGIYQINQKDYTWLRDHDKDIGTRRG